MSTTEASSMNTALDSPTLEGRRKSLRQFLIMFLVANVAAPILSEFIAPAPALVQEAADSVLESLPEWRYYTGIAAGCALLASGLFGVYRLWNFKWNGLEYLAFSVFFPYFLVLPVPLVQSAFGAYVDTVGTMIGGALLFLCCVNREIFDPAPVVNPPTADTGHSPASPSAS